MSVKKNATSVEYWRKEAETYKGLYSETLQLLATATNINRDLVCLGDQPTHREKVQAPTNSKEWYEQQLQLLIDEERYEEAAALKRRKENT